MRGFLASHFFLEITTLSKINIYQIFHKTELKSLLDPDFIPLDHCDYTQNNPEESNKWREWPILKKIGYDLAKADDADIWGFVSYKFNEKTNCSGKDFINFIKNNPDADVWFMEPNYKPFNPFLNPWQQGELYHPGISNIPNFMFQAAGNQINVMEIPMRICWYNFFAGTEKFWKLYFEVIDNMIEVAQQHKGLNDALFNIGASHGNDPTVPYFIFVVERMFPTILALSDLKAAGLSYNHDDFQLAPMFIDHVTNRFK